MAEVMTYSYFNFLNVLLGRIHANVCEMSGQPTDG